MHNAAPANLEPQTDTSASAAAAASRPAWPLEVRAIFDALTSPAPVSRERRKAPRKPCRVEAKLWPVKPSAPAGTHLPVYLRDYCPGAVSFVGQSAVPAGSVVDLEMPTSSGASQRTRCQIARCRQFHEGWFEGVLVLAR